MEMMTVSEAARLLGVCAPTVRVWSARGKLPVFRTSSGQRIFLRSDVEKLAKDRK